MPSAKQLLALQKETKAQNSLLPISSFVDDKTFVTKQGYPGVGLAIRGTSTEGLTDGSLETVSTRIRKGLKIPGDDYRIYQYAWKHSGEEMPADIPAGQAVTNTLAQRNEFLAQKGLFGVELFWILLREPAGGKKRRLWRKVFSFLQGYGGLIKISERRLQQEIEGLHRKAETVIADLRDVITPRLMSKQTLFYFLRVLCNLSGPQAKLRRLTERGETYIDHLLGDFPIECGREGLRIGENWVEVFTLAQPPTDTEPNLFEALQKIPCDFILATEWKGIDHRKAEIEIANAQSYFEAASRIRNVWSLVMVWLAGLFGQDQEKAVVTDKGALANIEELNELSIALNKDDELGEYSATLVFYGPDRRVLREAESAAAKVLNRFGVPLSRETYNAFNAYLSILPGNTAFNFRRLKMLQSSAAEMALAYRRDRGESRNEHLGAEYLLRVETEDGTPYDLNLHHEGVFGVNVSGKTGSGKSFLSQALLDHAQKYNPITLVMDVGGSYYNLCRKYDGEYMAISDLNFRAAPFQTEATARNRRSLSAFIRLLLENEGYKVGYQDTRRIFEEVGDLLTRPESQRRVSNLMLGDSMTAALHRWRSGGEFGTVFDNDIDEIQVRDFKVFDFQGIEEVPEVAEPIFFYLFMRHDRIVQDPALLGRFKLLWTDEAHRFLENATCRKQYVRSGKMNRKHNAGMAIVSQSPFDLKNVGLFEVISEVCPVKITLPNPSADIDAYQKLYHWNDQEVCMFRSLIGKRQFLLKKEEQPAQILNLLASPYEVATYSNDPNTNLRRDASIKKYGSWEVGIQKLAEELEGSAA